MLRDGLMSGYSVFCVLPLDDTSLNAAVTFAAGVVDVEELASFTLIRGRCPGK